MCAQCGCLQISETPPDLAKYYPKDYYSYTLKPSFKKTRLSRFLTYHRNNYFLFKKNILGWVLGKIHTNPNLEILSHAGINKNAKVLDVGCGIGHLLYSMKQAGMKNLLGVDPFIEKDLLYENGLEILKKEIDEVDNGWDLIMLNHVLEHIEHQHEMLASIFSKLNPGGCCLIRIPTVSSQAWEQYKENWVQLDAPRHLFLHSVKSISLLSKEIGFDIENIIYDSNEFQFIGSEQYLKNISLDAESSYLSNPQKSIFKKEDIRKFKAMAKQLNAENKGDQFSIFLRKPLA
jgi:ubiquinone/menaquinone biosynthesis C-methylase UbiE